MVHPIHPCRIDHLNIETSLTTEHSSLRMLYTFISSTFSVIYNLLTPLTPLDIIVGQPKYLVVQDKEATSCLPLRNAYK